MLSIKGTYDGKVLKMYDNIKINSLKKVIITFLDDVDEDITTDELHLFAQQGGALKFLDNVEEDIYTDTDLKVKY
jgi:hypothetical protein